MVCSKIDKGLMSGSNKIVYRLKAIYNIENEVSGLQDKLNQINNEERDMKLQTKSINEEQTKFKHIHSNLLMDMTKLRAQIREGNESESSSEDLIR